MNPDLLAAVRQAINDSLDAQAHAAVEAMERLGYILPAGTEYAVFQGSVTVELGFNTVEQAGRWAAANTADYVIRRRPVGVWEDVEEAPGWQSESPEPNTDPDKDKQ